VVAFSSPVKKGSGRGRRRKWRRRKEKKRKRKRWAEKEKEIDCRPGPLIAGRKSGGRIGRKSH